MISINKHNINGQDITFIDVEHGQFSCTFMDYGAAVVSIVTPDKDGNMESVVMAYDNIGDYIENDRHLNATIGPTAGRIENAQYTLDGQTIYLDKNFKDKHNLHGGEDALSYSFFEYEVQKEEYQTQVIFSLYSPASHSHYPGNQQYRIIYTVKEGELLIEFIAGTDQTALINLTNHAYFNLSGSMKSTILDHQMQINAGRILELGEDMIPQGVIDVPQHLDYRDKSPIKKAGFVGVDEPYLLDNTSFEHPQATLIDPTSKRRLDVYTTYPCIVCYTDNFPMPYELLFGATNQLHMGVCFETQNPPNGIHLDSVESSIVGENEEYYHKTLFTFSIEE